MITNFKIFETINEQTQIGDYVITYNKDEDDGEDNIWNYLNNSVGKFIDIVDYTKSHVIEYTLTDELYKKYSIFPPNKNNTINSNFELKNIKYWSKDKEELETLLTTKKYNL